MVSGGSGSGVWSASQAAGTSVTYTITGGQGSGSTTINAPSGSVGPIPSITLSNNGTTNSLNLTWSTDWNDAGSGGSHTNTLNTISVSGTSFTSSASSGSTTITGLSSGTSYTATNYAYAYYPYYVNNFANTATSTASTSSPAPTASISATKTGKTTATITWSSTNATSASVTGTNLSTQNALSGSVGVTGLSAGTTYPIGTWAISVSGAGGTASANSNAITTDSATPPAWTDQVLSTTLAKGTAYSDGVSATNSPTYSVYSGSLPAGLSLNSSTGAVTGTPTTANTYPFVLRATNSDGFVSASFSLTVPATPPVWTDNVLSGSLTVNSVYSDGVAATNSPTYSVSVGSLPTGLSLNTSTGAVTGTPTTAGTYSFTLAATNSDGTITQAFSLTVIPAIGVKVWNGTQFNFATAVKVYNGTAFVAATHVKYLTSTSPVTWETII